MPASSRQELTSRLARAARQYGISAVLFRHMAGERLGLNVTDMECLGLLYFQRIATPSELAEHTGLTSGATTAMLDRLERSGLIERRPNPDDRRGRLIVLVESGAAQLEPLFRPVRKAQEKLLDHYSAAELRLITGFLESSYEIWEQARRKVKST